MTFGERMKEIRQKNGISQRELGIELGVSQQTVAQYEKATEAPKEATLIKIASAFEKLGADASDLRFIGIEEELARRFKITHWINEKISPLENQGPQSNKDFLSRSNAFGVWLNEKGIRFEPAKLEDLTGKIFFIDKHGFFLTDKQARLLPETTIEGVKAQIIALSKLNNLDRKDPPDPDDPARSYGIVDMSESSEPEEPFSSKPEDDSST